MKELKNKIEQLYSTESDVSDFDIAPIKHELVTNLNTGKIRAAEPFNGIWKVNEWVKKGILLLFRYGKLSNMSHEGIFSFFDKDTLTVHPFSLEDSVRIVPGGSSIRTGSYIAKGVICMPPMYINIGAYIDEDTMIDSHALVGTCAQIGKRVHLSAASQIGGVLEPPGARPVIVEDDVMIGGNCGVYEGVLLRKRAVLGSGVILNSSTKVYDIINEKILKADKDNPLEIPESAVVIPGSRQIDTKFGKANGLSVSTAIIVKYRDEKTDARTALEQALR
ncbi:MAG: 2,3,4,5-tetrahydropyridine-2,6-dicarboxylate N-succinyltransferase [Ignavibacteria bacterium GWB2_35_12]|nr:MAG: 2,3,4,5-tetrahydropyridine-2,6-dicarboxylate N-succinyltransferase [Ignavibacteria bacterium GWA2_35_8]OGU41837.1 MAG: 2,3,4,5-tetrahydropyridine-2,6-dicarboxylate N-succinyltransferase [Ignavibacteria bacterium GWB2_35_12]OGU86061.1 MAG: 2,3,4,5-tetrahydropyridine-2,6-dicarboxylate N-succinyltransferase [Ignavibacteria bacterium RIFOXYA2_FULL_35_10]OGV23517.1 MAG: 2,3,4,5-tetrahydropyridine-2,6-dicarboxylate N-succinyltransferase [Ignavibacteria bacterium RIFOXYC2_FULL_35_21]